MKKNNFQYFFYLNQFHQDIIIKNFLNNYSNPNHYH